MTKEMKLSTGEITILDDDDYEYYSKWKWRNKHGYVARDEKYIDENGKRRYRSILLHRQIMKTPEGMVTDHINGNKMDNRKENLRICTSQQNSMNKKATSNTSSKFKGVAVKKGRYVMTIKVKGKVLERITFTDEIACANAYNYYAKIHHREYAKLNENIPFMSKDEWESYITIRGQSSKYHGVCWDTTHSIWQAYVYENGKIKSIGKFTDEIAAANCYNYYITSNNREDPLNDVPFLPKEQWSKMTKLKTKKTSKYKGVYLRKRRGKVIWESTIRLPDRKVHYVGIFKTELDAALAYNQQIIELGLPESKLNIIE